MLALLADAVLEAREAAALGDEDDDEWEDEDEEGDDGEGDPKTGGVVVWDGLAVVCSAAICWSA